MPSAQWARQQRRAAARAHLEQGRRGPGHLTPRMPTLLVRDARVVLLVGVLHHHLREVGALPPVGREREGRAAAAEQLLVRLDVEDAAALGVLAAIRSEHVLELAHGPVVDARHEPALDAMSPGSCAPGRPPQRNEPASRGPRGRCDWYGQEGQHAARRHGRTVVHGASPSFTSVTGR